MSYIALSKMALIMRVPNDLNKLSWYNSFLQFQPAHISSSCFTSVALVTIPDKQSLKADSQYVANAWRCMLRHVSSHQIELNSI